VWRWFENDGMNRYEFHLRISSNQYLDYYRGTARRIVVRCNRGLSIQFPASLLQRFVTENGIHGDFVLTCDEHHKNSRLERLE
jgi:hypothetical protein